MTSKEIKKYKDLMNNMRPLLALKTSDDFIDNLNKKIKELENDKS